MSSTVIIGAGIIGCSTAFYLTEHEDVDATSIHLVESSPEFFASASGKSGGFLAEDWFSPPVAPLGELSFRLHKELADQNDGRANWGYSLTTGTSYVEPVEVNTNPNGGDWLQEGRSRADVAGAHEFRNGDGPAWLARRHGDSVDTIGEQGSAAQVDPLRLSQFLLGKCRERYVQIHQPANVASLVTDDEGKLTAVNIKYDAGEEVEGAWTGRVFKQLFPVSKKEIPVTQYAGHSLVLRSPRWSTAGEAKGCHAVFSSMRTGFSPEVFSRIGGEIYIAGLNDGSLELPERATDAKIDNASIAQLKEMSRKLLSSQQNPDDLEVIREGLCFRPVTPNGTPILSKIEERHLAGLQADCKDGSVVYVAAGHGPWGISLSLGTGKVMSEMLKGQKTSANVSRLALR
ncbi:hypothetical protein B9Z65_4702 [Elsinoe australis]|uniref:FAD dependent oxidoreductase domain-containing protein n=1 Tax=Elsinoe australis TaxID=40998 RepID=A0A2P8A5S2_9PEZI|nr:hypothetical protein B9Z65_4702 [Elsinoe australis]